MEWRFFNGSIDIEGLRFIHTVTPHLLVQKIIKWHKDIPVLSPLTRVGDALSFKLNKELYQMVHNEFPQVSTDLVNERELSKVTRFLNDYFGEEVVDYKMDLNKVMAHYFRVADKFFNEHLILKYLVLVDKTTTDKNVVLVWGFPGVLPQIQKLSLKRLNVVVVGNLNYASISSFNDLQLVVITTTNDFLEVLDVEKFLSWLELKSKTVLTRQDINDYLHKKSTFKTFVIHQALNNVFL